MKLFNDYTEMANDTNNKHRVVTIGNFDGIHLGHQSIIAQGLNLAKSNNLELSVFTFKPHPAHFFRPNEPQLRLTMPNQKHKLLKQYGVQTVLCQNFSSDFAKIEADQFVKEIISGALKAQIVIVGENFRFGKDRKGDIDLLYKAGKTLGFKVVSERLITAQNDNISSSRIRKVIQDGQMELASRLLGRFHEIEGKVVHGKSAGKKLGFPTVNLVDVQVLLPLNGIYAAQCILENGQILNAAAYLGNRPTMGYGSSIEAFLLDFSGDLYDTRINLRFVSRLHGEKKFDSIDALKKQMHLDVKKVRLILEGSFV